MFKDDYWDRGRVLPSRGYNLVVVFNTECIVIVIINAFTIFAFARHPHLRKLTKYLIINLTMADLLVGAVTVPLSLYYPEEIEPGHGFSSRELICWTFRNIFPLASQANLSLISLERLHATLYPFRHCLIGKWVHRPQNHNWQLVNGLASVIWVVFSSPVCTRSSSVRMGTTLFREPSVTHNLIRYC